MKAFLFLVGTAALFLGQLPPAVLSQEATDAETEGDVVGVNNFTVSPTGDDAFFNDTMPDDDAVDMENNGTATTLAPDNIDIDADNMTSSASPTMAPYVAAVVGLVNLELVETPSLLEGESEVLFLNTTAAFLTKQFFFTLNDGVEIPGHNSQGGGDEALPLLEEEGVVVEIARQSQSLLRLRRRERRYLQEEATAAATTTPGPLYVTIQVTGIASFESPEDAADFDFDRLLQYLFIEGQLEFIEALQISGDEFFVSLDQANVVLDSTLTGDGNDSGIAGEEEEPNQEGTAAAPGAPPAPDNVQGTDDDGDEKPPLSRGTIVGIAVGGVVALVILYLADLYCTCCGCGSYCKCRSSGNNGSATKAATGAAAAAGTGSPNKNNARVESPPQRNKPWNRRHARDADSDIQNLFSTGSSSNRGFEGGAESSDVDSNVDLESQAMYSYNARGDSGSVFTAGNNSTRLHGANQSAYGNDNMSYAYSLEPGIEASDSDGVLLDHRSTNSQYNNYGDYSPTGLSYHGGEDGQQRGRVPIREIPQISINGDNHHRSADIVGLMSSSSLSTTGAGGGGRRRSDRKNGGSGNNHEGFGKIHIETAPSDLKLTESELAMLPSNLRSSKDSDSEHNVTTADYEEEKSPKDVTAVPSPPTVVVTRTVVAPSGKLGIVIDTTLDGPVVHNVNQSSRLKGKIFPGDIIVAIDDVDTRAMSASAITALMAKTAHQRRTLSVRGGRVVGPK